MFPKITADTPFVREYCPFIYKHSKSILLISRSNTLCTTQNGLAMFPKITADMSNAFGGLIHHIIFQLIKKHSATLKFVSALIQRNYFHSPHLVKLLFNCILEGNGQFYKSCIKAVNGCKFCSIFLMSNSNKWSTKRKIFISNFINKEAEILRFSRRRYIQYCNVFGYLLWGFLRHVLPVPVNGAASFLASLMQEMEEGQNC